MTAPAPPRQARRTHRAYIPGRRALTLLALIALPVVVAADLGSVALVKVSIEDDAGEAARAGMTVIQFTQKATPEGAEAAYQAASTVADLHRLSIDKDSFTIYADGAVKLTATRDAPTLLFKHFPGLRDVTDSTVTVTVGRPTW